MQWIFEALFEKTKINEKDAGDSPFKKHSEALLNATFSESKGPTPKSTNWLLILGCSTGTLVTLEITLLHWTFMYLVSVTSLRSFMSSVTSKKSPNVYKSCLKMVLLEKWKILTPLQKLLKNLVDLGKLIVATGFEKLPKVQ